MTSSFVKKLSPTGSKHGRDSFANVIWPANLFVPDSLAIHSNKSLSQACSTVTVQHRCMQCRSTLNLQACCRAELRKEHISSGSDPIQFVHSKDLFFSNESFTNDTTLQSWSWKLICNNKEASSNTTHLFISGKSEEMKRVWKQMAARPRQIMSVQKSRVAAICRCASACELESEQPFTPVCRSIHWHSTTLIGSQSYRSYGKRQSAQGKSLTEKPLHNK